MLTFREMEMDDLEDVIRLEEESFSTPWSANSLFTFFIRSDTFFCAALEDGKLVGYAGLTLVPPEGDLVNIAVDEACRGRGIGRGLLDFLLSEGEKRGITDVFLEVRISNTHARRLYDAAGFKFLAVRKDYYTDPDEDALLMKREGGK